MAEPVILIFGAGKIGRSFIGQLFSGHGYRVVFVDTDVALVEELNRRGEYPVVIKGHRKAERIVVGGVTAIHASRPEAVKASVVRADLAATAVGKNALASLAPLLAEGLIERERQRPGSVLDLILAENMRDAAAFFREELRPLLPSGYPLERRVGLVESSIGKMVPLMTGEDLEEDLLQVFAEPYNTLILDRRGFLGSIPEIPGLALKENMAAWVDRKAFIHNLGHATAAYAGYLHAPRSTYLWEVLEKHEVREFTLQVMRESAGILQTVHPGEFEARDLESHITDLLNRFRNRFLLDTLYRVGSDLRRKLGAGDRFMGPVRAAADTGRSCDTILRAMALGFFFKATDESGNRHAGDVQFQSAFLKDPEGTLEAVCGMRGEKDRHLKDRLLREIRHPNLLQP